MTINHFLVAVWTFILGWYIVFPDITNMLIAALVAIYFAQKIQEKKEKDEK